MRSYSFKDEPQHATPAMASQPIRFEILDVASSSANVAFQTHWMNIIPEFNMRMTFSMGGDRRPPLLQNEIPENDPIQPKSPTTKRTNRQKRNQLTLKVGAG